MNRALLVLSAFFFSYLFFLTGNLAAQDIIVRITGDTIHCKVDRTNDQFVYYFTPKSKANNEEVISRLEVSTIIYDFEAPDTRTSRKERAVRLEYTRYDIWVAYGLNHINIENPGNNDFEDYFRKLQTGRILSAGMRFFFSENLGFGVSYFNSGFSNAIGNVRYSPTGQVGTLSDDIRIQYIGAGVNVRFPLPISLSIFNLEVGAGYSFFRNEGSIIERYVMRAQGIGGHLMVDFDLHIGGGVYIPIKGGVNGFTVKDIETEVENPNSELGSTILNANGATDRIDITRLSLSIGLLVTF